MFFSKRCQKAAAGCNCTKRLSFLSFYFLELRFWYQKEIFRNSFLFLRDALLAIVFYVLQETSTELGNNQV